MISANIRPEVSGESIKFVCHIIVSVEKENVLEYIQNNSKSDLDEATRRIKELEAENARIREENERIKREFKTADETERKRLNEEFKRNERDFTVTDLLEKATALIQKRDYDGAEKLILQAIQIDPKNAMAWQRRADLCGSQGDLKKAVEYLNKAIELKPDYAEAWNSLGNVYSDMGDDT